MNFDDIIVLTLGVLSATIAVLLTFIMATETLPWFYYVFWGITIFFSLLSCVLSFLTLRIE